MTQRVAFLGPAGTFTEEALRASAPGPVEEVPYQTVYETVMAVQSGAVDRAVVPIENSLEGSVTATLDALAGEADRVRIAAEVVHPIHHCLVAGNALSLGDVERVISHPQATSQCARFLGDQLPRAERASASSTAEAVRIVASARKPWAALASCLSAELYECHILAEHVEDHRENLTRFVWLAPAGRGVGAGLPGRNSVPSKTSIVFWGFNDDSPGALVDVLGELAGRDINLTKIESRPRRVRLGHYMFFADLEGAAEDANVSAALVALRRRVDTLRILGSYAVARTR